jgi:hypothetical protein
MTTIITNTGASPQTPEAIRAEIAAAVAALYPGYTADLPGSLIDDVLGTITAAVFMQQQAAADLINSISPAYANKALLQEIGQAVGIPQGLPTNGSALVQFSGTPEYFIRPGFTVSDGSRQFRVTEGGSVSTGGTSPLLLVVATQSGSAPIPAGSITGITTSLPPGIVLTVSNPAAGTPGDPDGQSVESYRQDVLAAFSAEPPGVPSAVKSAILKIPGTVSRLVSFRITPAGKIRVYVGGSADRALVAGAIYRNLLQINMLEGSGTPGRDVVTFVRDGVDVFPITYVSPVAQSVALQVTYTPKDVNFQNDGGVNSAAVPALTAYLNDIPTGQQISALRMDEVFLSSVAAVLPADQIANLSFKVFVNGVEKTPVAGTQLYPVDPETYYTAAAVTTIRG